MVIKVEDIKSMRAHLEHLTQEIIDLKKILMEVDVRDRETRENAWNDILEASKDITRLWEGPSATEEIKAQREKTW